MTIHSERRQTRDFVYIGDVVKAGMTVLDADAARGRVFNVGSGEATSVAELADAVLAALGGDQHRPQADIDAIRSALGWEPRVPLRAGMQRTLAWARSARDGEPARVAS